MVDALADNSFCRCLNLGVFNSNESGLKGGVMLATNYDFIQEVGGWLSKFPWSHYGTFTFRFDRGAESARRIVKGFITSLDQNAKFAMVAEGHKYRASAHIHALINGLQGLDCFYLVNRWHKRNGIARIYPYDSTKGAAYYIAKNIQYETAELDIESM